MKRNFHFSYWADISHIWSKRKEQISLRQKINIAKWKLPTVKSRVPIHWDMSFITCFKTICSEITKNIFYFLDQHILPDIKCRTAMAVSYATKGKVVKAEGTANWSSAGSIPLYCLKSHPAGRTPLSIIGEAFDGFNLFCLVYSWKQTALSKVKMIQTKMFLSP